MVQLNRDEVLWVDAEIATLTTRVQQIQSDLIVANAGVALWSRVRMNPAYTVAGRESVPDQRGARCRGEALGLQGELLDAQAQIAYLQAIRTVLLLTPL